MASDAAHLQEAVLETVAFQALLELPLKIAWQRRTLGCKVGQENRVVGFDKMVKKGSFRAMARVTKRATARTGFPAGRLRQHDRILASSS